MKIDAHAIIKGSPSRAKFNMIFKETADLHRCGGGGLWFVDVCDFDYVSYMVNTDATIHGYSQRVRTITSDLIGKHQGNIVLNAATSRNVIVISVDGTHVQSINDTITDAVKRYFFSERQFDAIQYKTPMLVGCAFFNPGGGMIPHVYGMLRAMNIGVINFESHLSQLSAADREFTDANYLNKLTID